MSSPETIPRREAARCCLTESQVADILLGRCSFDELKRRLKQVDGCAFCATVFDAVVREAIGDPQSLLEVAS